MGAAGHIESSECYGPLAVHCNTLTFLLHLINYCIACHNMPKLNWVGVTVCLVSINSVII